jgi:nucleoid-associated protein YgaU
MSSSWDMDVVPRTSGVSRPQQLGAHVVVEDDTLFSISNQWYGHGNNANQVAQANGIHDASDMFVGQVLIIPVGAN